MTLQWHSRPFPAHKIPPVHIKVQHNAWPHVFHPQFIPNKPPNLLLALQNSGADGARSVLPPDKGKWPQVATWGGLVWVLGIISSHKGFASAGTGLGRWWNHPWKCFINLWMWCLGTHWVFTICFNDAWCFTPPLGESMNRHFHVSTLLLSGCGENGACFQWFSTYYSLRLSKSSCAMKLTRRFSDIKTAFWWSYA